MLMPRFDFHAPETVAAACEILATHGDRANVIAGGTDLMVNMKKQIVAPAHLVSLARIEAMKGIAVTDDALEIGASVTVADLATADAVGTRIAALAGGARALGTPLIRNRATIGGNIGSARPAADLPPSLMVYGAEAVVTGPSGERSVALGDFFTGPGMTVLTPDEIITRFRIPAPPAGAGAGYLNLGVRKGQDCNIVNVASYLALAADGHISEARIVMGSVGPTPVRATTAETLLKGERPDDALFARAGKAAAGDCTPILDFRGSAEYRRDMVGVLTRRTLAMAVKEAGRD
jgi:aerobic carbon-monoxide dehydrogenase medium subunit